MIISNVFGELAEWSNALPWKGSKRVNRFKGSNPLLTEAFLTILNFQLFFDLTRIN